MTNDRQSMGGGLEVDEAEALDAVAIVNARHGEEIGAIVDLIELAVGQVAEEAHGEITGGRRGAQALLVVGFVARADHPVLDLLAEPRRERLQRLQGEELALAGMEASHGKDDDPPVAFGRGRADDR